MNQDIQIVATGKKWIGDGVRTTSSVINEMIDSTEDSLLLTVFIISNESILKQIIKALDKGISIDILINKDNELQNFILDELIDLEKNYNHLNIYQIFDAFLHAKVMISDYKKVLIGSANLTNAALITNYELGLMVENPEIAYKLEGIIRRLI